MPKSFSALVVDDIPAIQEIFQRMLIAVGFATVSTASSVVEALAHLQTTRYDLVIADYSLEKTPGIEIVKRIRHSEGTTPSDVPFILITGHADMEAMAEAMAEGADAFLVKPIGKDQLVAKVCQLLKDFTPLPT